MAIGLQRMTFASDGKELVGHLRLPEGFSENARYPAVVVVGPGSAVKEQAGALYADKLAARGYVTMVFDPSYQGESAGAPRDLESPAKRVEDIRSAIDSS